MWLVGIFMCLRTLALPATGFPINLCFIDKTQRSVYNLNVDSQHECASIYIRSFIRVNRSPSL